MILFFFFLPYRLSKGPSSLPPSCPMGRFEHDDDPYEVLGLRRGSTKLEIKEAYMRLAQQHHPDKNMSADREQRMRAEARFKAVQHAYNVLSGKERFQHAHQPARWAEAEAAAAAEMQKSALTNKQAAIWVSGLCFLSAGFLSVWTAVRARGDQLSAQNNMQLSARKKYIQQAAKWDRELSTEQLRHLMDERRDRSIQRGLDEGVKGAATMAALMAMFLGAIKGAQFKGLAKSFLKSPLVSFHLVRAILYFAPARSCAVGMGTCVCPRTPVPSAPSYVCMHVLLCVGARVSHLILSDLGRDTCACQTLSEPAGAHLLRHIRRGLGLLRSRPQHRLPQRTPAPVCGC